MRRRVAVPPSAENVDVFNGKSHFHNDLRAPGLGLMRHTTWLCVLVFYAGLFGFIHVRNHFSYPEPKTLANASPGDFVEERARQHLLNITNIGSRCVGTRENEVLVVQYLTRELDKIRQNALNVHHVQVDVQKAKGTFSIKFLGEFASYYDNINNVLVKLSPRGGAIDSLLVSCHYDSVLDSPGASDDAVSCSLMLEVLRVLSQSEEALMHNVIFIFNGAEESIMQGSHGFIAGKHPWTNDIRAFINLDAAGAGGREVLFQAGPENPWLISAYAKNAPHPFASVFGQELFESGIVPSDTDYRIYRDHGGIPGLDIAYVHNGYVYHTKYDRPDMIPDGCIQRGGENLLSVVRAIANSSMLSDPGDERHGGIVFYDLVGYVTVYYTATIGRIINSLTIVLVLMSLRRKIIAPTNSKGPHAFDKGFPYLKHLVGAVLLVFLSWVIVFAIVSGFGYVLDMSGRSMSWFTNVWLLCGLYVTPAIILLLAMHGFLRVFLYKDVTRPWLLEGLYFDAHVAILTILLVVLTYLGINSAALIVLFVAFPVLCRNVLPALLGINLQENPNVFIIIHLMGQFLGSLVFLENAYGVVNLFLPIMGRTGTEVIADVFVAILLTASVLVCMFYQVGLVYVTSHSALRAVLKSLVGVFFVTLLLAAFTPIGFPYRHNLKQPSNQRHLIQHIVRTMRNASGIVTHTDSGILMMPFDRQGVGAIKPYMSVLRDAKPTDCTHPYCGWPYFYPMIMFIRHGHYLPSSKPIVKPEAKLKLVQRVQVEGNIEKFTFNISGPNHVRVFLTPKSGVTPVRWSVGNGKPSPTQVPTGQSDTYFVWYSSGSTTPQPWQLWIDLKYEDTNMKLGSVIEIALSAHYLDDKHRSTELKDFLASMPEWTVPVGWTSTYDSWWF